MDNENIEKNIPNMKDFDKLTEWCNEFSKKFMDGLKKDIVNGFFDSRSNYFNEWISKDDIISKVAQVLWNSGYRKIDTIYEDLKLCPSTPKDVILFKYDIDKFTMEEVEELVKYLERCFPNYEIVAIPKENQIKTIPKNELIEFLEKTIKELKNGAKK